MWREVSYKKYGNVNCQNTVCQPSESLQSSIHARLNRFRILLSCAYQEVKIFSNFQTPKFIPTATADCLPFLSTVTQTQSTFSHWTRSRLISTPSHLQQGSPTVSLTNSAPVCILHAPECWVKQEMCTSCIFVTEASGKLQTHACIHTHMHI
jgi:hypothetical protein